MGVLNEKRCNTDAITNKDSYIANLHSIDLTKLYKFKESYKKYIKTEKTPNYKLKVLKKLYKDSIIYKIEKFYLPFNQVAVNYSIDLDYLEIIQLNETNLKKYHKDKYLKLVKYIK